MALDAAEAAKLAEAAQQVQALYDVPINPKTLAWFQLVIVAGSIYAPRMIAVSMRKKNEKKSKVKSNTSNVVNAEFPFHAPTG